MDFLTLPSQGLHSNDPDYEANSSVSSDESSDERSEELSLGKAINVSVDTQCTIEPQRRKQANLSNSHVSKTGMIWSSDPPTMSQTPSRNIMIY